MVEKRLRILNRRLIDWGEMTKRLLAAVLISGALFNSLAGSASAVSSRESSKANTNPAKVKALESPGCAVKGSAVDLAVDS